MILLLEMLAEKYKTSCTSFDTSKNSRLFYSPLTPRLGKQWDYSRTRATKKFRIPENYWCVYSKKIKYLRRSKIIMVNKIFLLGNLGKDPKLNNFDESNVIVAFRWRQMKRISISKVRRSHKQRWHLVRITRTGLANRWAVSPKGHDLHRRKDEDSIIWRQRRGEEIYSSYCRWYENVAKKPIASMAMSKNQINKQVNEYFFREQVWMMICLFNCEKGIYRLKLNFIAQCIYTSYSPY